MTNKVISLLSSLTGANVDVDSDKLVVVDASASIPDRTKNITPRELLQNTFGGVTSRASNTILGASDHGKTFVATSNFTQTFDLAATLGSKWKVDYRIESGVTIVFDPTSTEQIDGGNTKSVTGPSGGAIACDGSAFYTVGFIDTSSFAPTASPVLTGNPTAPTAAADDNDTSIATTAYVIGQASATTPAVDGTAAIGTSKKYARADHVHPQWAFVSSQQNVAASTNLTVAHGLGRKPTHVDVILQCTSADANHASGDELQFTATTNAGNVSANCISWDTTNVYIVTMNAIFIVDRSSTAIATLTMANWKFVVRCA
jgi:hypothetical protein